MKNLKKINLKSASERLTNREMKSVTGGYQGEGEDGVGKKLRCWCNGSAPNAFFYADSYEDADARCGDNGFGCFLP